MFKIKKLLFSVIVPVLSISLSGCGLSAAGLASLLPEGRAREEVAPAASADELFVGEETFISDEDIIYGVIDGENAIPAAADIPESADGPYAYQTLDDTGKAVYDEIVATFTERAEEAEVSTLDADELERAYEAVRCDHCEFFWVEQFGYVTYSKGDEIVSLAIRPHYAMSAEEQEELQLLIDAEADRMLEDAPVGGSDFDKALYVYETLIREVDYDLDAPYGQTIVSAFLEHATVCQGYSYATQYLLERLGVPCTTVPGTAQGESHAWNLVFMDGDYYYIDTTWGNSEYVSRYGADTEEVIPYKFADYDYFGMTTEMLLESHQPEGDIPLPLCEAVADNYYVHEGLYIDVWDPDRIGEILREGYEGGEDMVRLRFSDAELYGQAMQYFLYDGGVFDFCAGLGPVRYLESSGSNVMVVVFR